MQHLRRPTWGTTFGLVMLALVSALMAPTSVPSFAPQAEEPEAQWEPCVKFPYDIECCWRPED